MQQLLDISKLPLLMCFVYRNHKVTTKDNEHIAISKLITMQYTYSALRKDLKASIAAGLCACCVMFTSC